MADNLGVNPIPFSSSEEGNDYPRVAMNQVSTVVRDHFQVADNEPLTIDGKPVQYYLVWFAFVMGGYKALISTNIPDGQYYEVTYNKDKHETYVDCYVKVNQKIFSHV